MVLVVELVGVVLVVELVEAVLLLVVLCDYLSMKYLSLCFLTCLIKKKLK